MKSEVELSYIDENYIAHGMCGKCGGDNHQKLEIEPIINNCCAAASYSVHTAKKFRNSF